MDTIQDRGEALRRYIKSQGMTQRQAAEKIGISAPHMANILNGRDGMGQKKVGKIVAAFPEIDPGYLLTGEGVLCPPPGSVRIHQSQRVAANGTGIQAIGDHALAVENAQLREQLAQVRAEKDRLLGIIETLTSKP